MKYPFPKLDLHFHLDGSMVPETTLKLAKERNVKMPCETLEEYKEFLKRTADCGDVGEYLARFDISSNIMQDHDALVETTYATVKMAAETLAYAEIRFAPQLHTLKGMTQKEVIDAIIEGKNKALAECPTINVNLILCCMIEPWDNHLANEETVKLYMEYVGKGDIVALDLAGFEDSVPMDSFAYLFNEPRARGLAMTIHGGDNGVPINCSKVINWGATRIGHGHRCYDDPDVLKKVIDTQTALEICLSSNIQCKTQPSFAQHPAKKLLDMGAKVTLNTDNMVLANITIEDEYDHALNEGGFTYNDLIKCNINSVESSFMLPEQKEKLIAELKSYLQ